jgi:parallel beta-helix repeat protein
MKAKHTRRVATAVMLAMLLPFAIFFAAPNMLVKANSNVIYVPADYEKIQWAINNATAGSTIFVSSGTYYEHLIIDKPLTLKGENQESIIDGNYTEDIIIVTASNVNISEFTIQNSGLGFYDSGIRLYCSNYNNISYNTIINNGHGISLEDSNCSIVISNNVSNNKCGIGLIFSDNNTITSNNVFSSDDCGIGLDYSNNNSITGNTVSNNGYGIWICHARQNIVFHNNIINNTIQNHLFDSINIFDNDFEGNYWSNYDGKDAEPDGIGDTYYVINENNTDRYPLIGMFSDFKVTLQEEIYHVTTICNSTISAFQFNQQERTLSFNVTGPDLKVGFCRITIPKALINGTYIVLVNGEETDVTVLPISNSTHAFLYFTYTHSTKKVVIIPEFPLNPILVLIITMVIGIIIIKKSRKLAAMKTHKYVPIEKRDTTLT